MKKILIAALPLFFVIFISTEAQTEKETILKSDPNEYYRQKQDTGEVQLPSGSRSFTPEQDSIYAKAKEQALPFSVRAARDLDLSRNLWRFESRLMEGTPWQVAMRDMLRLNPDIYAPSGVEMVQRDIQIRKALEVPYAKTLPVAGWKPTFAEIARFFGVSKDYSPNINYELTSTSEVEIVIYSVKAVVIKTVFRGVQPPGNYNIRWSATDENGNRVPPGDYIAEVRIGDERFIRKRIIID